MALVIIGVVAAIRLSARRLATVDTALDRIAAILLVVTLVLIVPFQVTAASRGATAVVEPKPDTTTAEKRDVYWLIFDRYGSDRSYELLYGIHNDDVGLAARAGLHRPRQEPRQLRPDRGLDPDHDEHDPPQGHPRHARSGQHRPAPGPGPDAVLAGGPPVQGARLPLLPHRLVVDAQRPRRAQPTSTSTSPGRRTSCPRSIDESAVPAAIKRLKLEHVTDRRARPPLQAQRLRARRAGEHASTSPVPSSSSGTSCSPTRPPSSTATAAS